MIRRHDNRGMSMLETIIAIGIIVMALLGALVLIISTIFAGTTSTNRLRAVNLAREGVEVVRMKRDSNWLGEAVALDDCDGEAPEMGTCEWHTDLYDWGQPPPPADSVYTAIATFQPNPDFDSPDWDFRYPGPGERIPYMKWYLDFTVHDIDEIGAKLHQVTTGKGLTMVQFNDTTPIPDDYLQDSIFRRLIKILPICETTGEFQEYVFMDQPFNYALSQHCDETNEEYVGVRVVSEVQWDERGKMYSEVVEEHLYNWQ